MVGYFFKARKKLKPGINYILFLLYLVGWAPSNSKIHILSQGANIVQTQGRSSQICTAHQKQWSMLKNHKINYVFIFSILYHLSDYETKLGLACFGLI